MIQLKFSKVEVEHLLRAWILVSLAFAIILKSGSMFQITFLYYFIIAGITVGIGFLLHELAHKYFAQRYGCFAEFRSDPFMLFIGVAMSFFGFVLIAPGAVMIHGTITTKRNGIISIAGPFTNVILAGVFLALAFAQNTLVSEVAKYGLMINAWLAAFNMIPFGNIDGQKILKWSKTAYFLTLALAIGFLVAYFALFTGA